MDPSITRHHSVDGVRGHDRGGRPGQGGQLYQAIVDAATAAGAGACGGAMLPRSGST
jgi:hypothetical protein